MTPPEPTRMRAVIAAIWPIMMSGAELAIEGRLWCSATQYRAKPRLSASRARSSELRSATAPEEPAATGDRSRTERATGGAGLRASKRPRAPQAPFFFPAGELSLAELQREGGVDRVEARNAWRSVGEIDLRAGAAG